MSNIGTKFAYLHNFLWVGRALEQHVCILSPVYDDIERRSIYQNVQLFIRSKNDISAVAIFKYSLCMFKETILHRKYQLT